MELKSNFKPKYEKNCNLYNTIPMSGVLLHLDKRCIELNADKISACDWNPLIDTIGSDHSLAYISIRSYYRSQNSTMRSSHLLPAIYDKNLLHRLCSAIASSISKAKHLRCLILQGLPLDRRDIAILAQGLKENQTIRQLSFEGSSLGDSGIFRLVPILRDKVELFWLNVTSCRITETGAIRLCDLVQVCFYITIKVD